MKILLFFALAAAAAAHASAQPIDGKQIYEVRCASCHGFALQGGPQAPPLLNVDAAMVDFMLQTGRMPAEAPSEQEYRKQPEFSQPQIAAIVNYVMTRSQGSKTLPAVAQLAPRPETLRKGREIFEESCQQCHGATARGGGALGYRNIAPSLMDDTRLEIAEAVREGPDVMPVFGPRVIDDQSLDSLIAYVEFLKNGQYNPGGLQLVNMGPVAEGFIAWTFGIGVLILLVRRIGGNE